MRTRLPGGSIAALTLIQIVLVAAHAAPAGAAVRNCKPTVTGAAHEAATEVEAPARALANWAAAARQYGAGYDTWRLANNRNLACKAQPNGSTLCQARGDPCTIQQVPRQPGPGPLLPKGKTKTIDI